MGILDSLRIKKGISDALEKVRQDGLSIGNILPEYINYDVALAAVQQNGLALQYINLDKVVPFVEGVFDTELTKKKRIQQNDIKKLNIVLAAVRQNPRAIAYAGGYTLNEKVQYAVIDAIYASGNEDKELVKYFNEYRIKEILKDYNPQANPNLKFIAEYISRDGDLIKFVPYPTYEEIEASLNQDAMNIRFIAHTYHLYYAAAKLAVKKDGLALQHVFYDHDCYQYHKVYYDIALEAVKQNGMALQYVDSNIDNYDDICLAAVRQNGLALQYIDDSHMHMNIILNALRQNFIAIQFVSESWFNREEFIQQVLLLAAQSNLYSSEDISRISNLYNIMNSFKGKTISFEYMNEFRSLINLVLPKNDTHKGIRFLKNGEN